MCQGCKHMVFGMEIVDICTHDSRCMCQDTIWIVQCGVNVYIWY